MQMTVGFACITALNLGGPKSSVFMNLMKFCNLNCFEFLPPKMDMKFSRKRKSSEANLSITSKVKLTHRGAGEKNK